VNVMMSDVYRRGTYYQSSVETMGYCRIDSKIISNICVKLGLSVLTVFCNPVEGLIIRMSLHHSSICSDQMLLINNAEKITTMTF